MEDIQVRDALLDYVAGGPPSRLSSDGVLAAGRRSRRRHRAAAVGSSLFGVAALGAVAAVLLPTLLRGPATTGPAPVGGPGWTVADPSPFCAAAAQPVAAGDTPTSEVNQKNGHLIEGTTEPAEHAQARLTCRLMTAVIADLPGASFLRDPSTPAGTTPLQVVANDAGMPGYNASAIVGDAGGVGTIGFGFTAAYETTQQAVAECTGPCTVHTGPHGEVVTVLSVGDNGRHLVNIRVYAGRTTVFVSASNGDIRNDPVPGPHQATVWAPAVGRADLPLSVEKLIEIAAAPELTLFP